AQPHRHALAVGSHLQFAVLEIVTANCRCDPTATIPHLMRTLIRNGRIVTAVDDYRADILIEDGKVAMIGKEIDVKADKKIDAKGRLVIPGGIDPHTHMDLPFGGTSSSDDFETGTRAAAFGGTTTIIDFAVQYHDQSLNQALDVWFAKAEGKATIDYGFHMIVTDLPDQR